MRQRRKWIIPVATIAAIALIAGGAGIYFVGHPAALAAVRSYLGAAEPEARGLMASGFIEADEVVVAPELGGRVVELLADEGDEVEAGQVLVQLDSTMLDAQIEAAQANLDRAQANLNQALAGPRPERIRQAEAALAQAQAARDGAYRVWQDLIATRDNPQELDARIAQAQAEVAAAEAALAQATALKDAAEIAYDAYWKGKEREAKMKEKLAEIPPPLRPHVPGMPLEVHLVPNAYWKAWVGVNTAQAGLDGARAALNDLYQTRDNPQDLNAQVNAAEAQYRAAKAAVERAAAQLDALKAGATDEEIAALEAQVEQAQAALDTLRVTRGKQTIVAPIESLVLERSIHRGELAAPGVSVLTLGNLDKVTLTVYVPEHRLGQVHIGQHVEVRVDSFPNRRFMGAVEAIAHEAEFTPRNVQTQEERITMVFAVDVTIPNPEHLLKPGVPADAVMMTQEAGEAQ